MALSTLETCPTTVSTETLRTTCEFTLQRDFIGVRSNFLLPPGIGTFWTASFSIAIGTAAIRTQRNPSFDAML